MNAPISIENFKAGRKEAGLAYHFFVPEMVNRQWNWSDPELNTLIEKASISLGRLNSFANLVPNVDLFVQLHVTKEAVISSRIEGTQTSMDEALLQEEEISPERKQDWFEVKNYTTAMNEAIKKLHELPLSSRLLKMTHAYLLSGVRGETKLPGQFRTSQNWIGGRSLSDAVFIPPADRYVNELMGDLENFIHNKDIHVPVLIRAGIAHYQFETIHPFLDGNGRIGRLLITLFLISEQVMELPLLYLSAYFEKEKSLYYDNLTAVREKNDLMQWLKYFLKGVNETADKSASTLSKILQLKAESESQIRLHAGRRSASAFQLLNELFRNPVVRISRVEKICSLSAKAASDLVSFFEDQGILKEITKKERKRIYVFVKYFSLFD
jgi:Fic family protein